MRILRLVLGVLILLQAFFTKTWIFIFFGLLLSYTAWENTLVAVEKKHVVCPKPKRKLVDKKWFSEEKK
ncbi:hypothetical protein HMPREF2660_00400 [Weeksella sp. HMSC059D05]|nr:hypothetical protein HMPREF2660_00400 [Weeksella sp. HMSC059D05]